MRHKWPLIPLGEVLTERRETPSEDDLASGLVRIVEKIFFDTGRIRLRRDGSTRTGMILVRPGDLVVSGINAAKGAIAIYDPHAAEPVAATIHYGAYVPDPDRVDVRFLWWMLRSGFFQDLLNEHVPGGIKTELKAKRLLPVPVPMPSLKEQRRIVARIEEVAAQVHKVRTLRQECVSDSERIVFAGCEAALRRAETHFPGKALEALVDQQRGISYGVVQTGKDTEDGVPTLRAGDLQWFACNTANVKRVSPEIEAKYERTRLRGGELLLRIRGGVGALAVCPPEMIGGNVSREIAVIPPVRTVDPAFAMYLLAAPTNQERMAGHIKGTSYVGLNLRDVRPIRLPLPPLSEQRRIVGDLDSLRAEADRLKALQAETAVELDALLPAILDCAFKGEL
jgi:type I restriction enzyme S subunit